MPNLAGRIREAMARPQTHGWVLQAWINIRPGEPTQGQLRLQAQDKSGRYLHSVSLASLEWSGSPEGPLQAAWCLRELVRAMDASVEGVRVVPPV